MAQLGPQEIYEFFQTADLTPLTSTRDTVQQLISRYESNGMDIRQLGSHLADGWSGRAQEAAAQGLAPLGEDTFQTSDKLGEFHASLDAQLAMFYITATKITPLPTRPTTISNPLPSIAAGTWPSSVFEQAVAYNVAAQQNVDAYQEYASYIQDTAAGMPDFSGGVDSRFAPIEISAGSIADSAKGGTQHRTAPRTGPAVIPPTNASASSTSAASGVPLTGTASTGTSLGGNTGPISNASPTGNTDPGSNAGTTAPASAAQPTASNSSGDTVPPGSVDSIGGRTATPGAVVGVMPVGTGGAGVPLETGGRGGAALDEGSAAVGEEEALAEQAAGGLVEEPVPTGLGGRKQEDRERETKFVQKEDRSVEFGVPELFPPRVLGERPKPEQ